jgi:hypothetical protein
MARYGPYYFALGRFVQNFADAEGMILSILWQFAETTPEVSQSIFSGTHGKGAIDFIKRICEAKHLPPDAELETSFAQFQVLNDARNTILHHGALIDGDGLVSTNEWMANKLPRTIKRFPVSAAILDDMAFDAETIRFRLIMFSMIGKMILLPEPIQPLRERADQPWRYKPPQQASPPRKTPDKGEAHPRQQQSSPEKPL